MSNVPVTTGFQASDHPGIAIYEAVHGQAPSRVPKRKRSDNSSPYEELFAVLMNATHDDAVSIIKRLRTTGDVSTVLSQAKEADLLLQLRLVPETRRRYDLPTLIDMPDFLLTPDNPYLE